VELSKRIEDEKNLQCNNPRKQIHQEANPSENRQESSASSSHRAFGFRCCDAASRRNEMKISSVMMDEMSQLLLKLRTTTTTTTTTVFSKHWKIPSFYLSFCIPELLHPSYCCNLRTSKIVKESTGGSSSLKIDR